MNTGQRTIASFLALIAALLALNLIVKGTGAATAGQKTSVAGADEPVLVDGDFSDEAGGKIWRFFGDGTVDIVNVNTQGCTPVVPVWCDSNDVGPHVILPANVPPGSPGPRVVAGHRGGSSRVYRFWSDGSVDVTSIGFAGDTNWCSPFPTCGPNSGPFQLIGPAPHAACAFFDSDLDGEIGVNDFLDLLAKWGPCQ